MIMYLRSSTAVQQQHVEGSNEVQRRHSSRHRHMAHQPTQRRAAQPQHSEATAQPQRSHSAAPQPTHQLRSFWFQSRFSKKHWGAVRTARPGGTAAAGRCRPRPADVGPPVVPHQHQLQWGNPRQHKPLGGDQTWAPRQAALRRHRGDTPCHTPLPSTCSLMTGSKPPITTAGAS